MKEVELENRKKLMMLIMNVLKALLLFLNPGRVTETAFSQSVNETFCDVSDKKEQSKIAISTYSMCISPIIPLKIELRKCVLLSG